MSMDFPYLALPMWRTEQSFPAYLVRPKYEVYWAVPVCVHGFLPPRQAGLWRVLNKVFCSMSTDFCSMSMDFCCQVRQQCDVYSGQLSGLCRWISHIWKGQLVMYIKQSFPVKFCDVSRTKLSGLISWIFCHMNRTDCDVYWAKLSGRHPRISSIWRGQRVTYNKDNFQAYVCGFPPSGKATMWREDVNLIKADLIGPMSIDFSSLVRLLRNVD